MASATVFVFASSPGRRPINPETKKPVRGDNRTGWAESTRRWGVCVECRRGGGLFI
jgi:hypothetical protein